MALNQTSLRRSVETGVDLLLDPSTSSPKRSDPDPVRRYPLPNLHLSLASKAERGLARGAEPSLGEQSSPKLFFHVTSSFPLARKAARFRASQGVNRSPPCDSGPDRQDYFSINAAWDFKIGQDEFDLLILSNHLEGLRRIGDLIWPRRGAGGRDGEDQGIARPIPWWRSIRFGGLRSVCGLSCAFRWRGTSHLGSSSDFGLRRLRKRSRKLNRLGFSSLSRLDLARASSFLAVVSSPKMAALT